MFCSRRIVVMATIALTMGCASSHPAAATLNPNLISTEEISGTSASNAYDLK